MHTGPLVSLLGYFRRTLQPSETLVSDAELLQRWTNRRDQSAFELLMWRHGRLVLSVCQRWLSERSDIEDAFQATFLVLVRKASAISHQQALASWLYTVAYRIALDARSRRASATQLSEAQEQSLLANPPTTGDVELQRMLDEEIGRLSGKYRLPFVLCHLEGKSNEEAAKELGCPVGTVQSRLSRARKQLRDRLTRRGVEPPAMLPILVGDTVSGELLRSTLAAVTAYGGTSTLDGAISGTVATLLNGALQSMFYAKIKSFALVATVMTLTATGGVIGYNSLSAQSATGTTSLPRGASPLATVSEIDALETQLKAALAQVKLLEAQLAKLRAAKEPSTSAPRGVLDRPKPSGSEIALLKKRRDVAQAELRAAKAIHKEMESHLAVSLIAMTRIPGAVDKTDLSSKRIAITQAEVEVSRKELLVAEAEAALESALAMSEVDKPKTDSMPKSGSLEERVSRLEKLVETLTKQVETLDKSRAR